MRDPKVQIALLIYESRIQGYRRLKEIDEIIDSKTTPALIREFTEIRILNNQCFRELEAFNKTGEWLYEHPLIVHYSERQILIKLKTSDPEEFFKQYQLCKQNIARYSSYVKSETRTAEQRQKDAALLRKHQERDVMFRDILKM